MREGGICTIGGLSRYRLVGARVSWTSSVGRSVDEAGLDCRIRQPFGIQYALS